MATEYPWLVNIPEHVAAVIGEADADHPRLYRATGDDRTYRKWWDVISGTWRRGLMSPGGAAMQAGVSRAALHKALREGRLTGFAFHVEESKKGLLGRTRTVARTTPYLYLPVAECRAWGEFVASAIRKEIDRGEAAAAVSAKWRRELEGEKPDWDAFFIDLPRQKRKKK